MAAIVATVAYLGLEARAVEVQVQLIPGLPAFNVVGLADKAVGESRERVRGAIAGMGLSLPPKRIAVNLSPADLPKEGSHFDLPIALALLAAMGVVDAEALADYVIVGELGLDARITASPGVLLAALHASEIGKGLVCPAAQGSEAAWAGEIEVIAAPDLLSLLNHFKGHGLLSPPKPGTAEPIGHGPDLRQVKGQETAKRALEIAAAGSHNLLMVGPPGSGKSLMASCLPGILPPLDPAEALEVSMVQSVAGTLSGGRLTRTRPFRAPHHSASMAALTGGGLKVKPGEVSLAHLGVLFLDELPEFQRAVLDSLRQPLETGTVSVARANAHVTFPARVQLIAAMNPCRCGHLGDASLACARAPKCAADYQAKVSGPLLDRNVLAFKWVVARHARQYREGLVPTDAASGSCFLTSVRSMYVNDEVDGPRGGRWGSTATSHGITLSVRRDDGVNPDPVPLRRSLLWSNKVGLRSWSDPKSGRIMAQLAPWGR
jgi:magnesium chelatase family protein